MGKGVQESSCARVRWRQKKPARAAKKTLEIRTRLPNLCHEEVSVFRVFRALSVYLGVFRGSLHLNLKP